MIGASGTSAGTLGVLVAGATILAMGIADLKNAIDRLVKNAKKLYEGTCKNAAVKKYEDTLEEIDKAFPCPIREENPGFENRRNEKRAEAYRELLSDRAKCESGIWPGPSETLKDLSF